MIIEGVVNFGSIELELNTGSSRDLIRWDEGFFSVQKLTPDVKAKYAFTFGVNFVGPRGSECSDDSGIITRSNEYLDVEVVNALYDEASQTLILTRDIFGIIPIYYLFIPGSFVAFSTSLVSLLKMPLSAAYVELDFNRIASYCTYLGDQAGGYSSNTFYKNIKTVLPGHRIFISASETKSHPIASFQPEKWSHLHSLEDFGSAFKSLFSKSVEHLVDDSNEDIASHLSGGLDSSSISAVASSMVTGNKLHTLYLDTKTKYSNESDFAESVASKIGSKHHSVTPSDEDYKIISNYTGIYGHPECMVISPSSQGSLMEFAHNLGCKVLLIGHDGDSIVGSGLETITDAVTNRDWPKLKGLIEKRAEYANLHRKIANWDTLSIENKKIQYTRHLAVSKFFEQIQLRNVSKTVKSLFEISTNLNVSPWYFFKEGFRRLIKKADKGPKLTKTIIKANLPFRTETRESLSDILRGNLPLGYKVWFDDVFNGQAIISSEQFYALGNYYRLENRFPFYDKDLFELCVAVPRDIKFGRGIGREHFREAMKDLLPEKVRSRPGKANFSIYGRDAALRLYHQSQEFMKDDGHYVWNIIDKEKYLVSVQTMLNANSLESDHNLSKFHVTTTISLAIWLDWLKKNNLLTGHSTNL